VGEYINMANKKTVKRTPKAKTNVPAKATKKAKKQVTAPAKNKFADYKDLFYGTMSAIAVYVFALWAIDSGSLWVYALSFASVYYTIHFYRLFIQNKFFNNDKPSKARTAEN
jgi:hypothetical protein